MANPSSSDYRQRLAESSKALARLAGGGSFPDTLLVLGSGFKGFETKLADATTADVAALPHFPVPRVEGHGASLVLGRVGGRRVAVMTGRVHLYEGHDASDVVYPIRAFATAGVKRVLLTNAAGSVVESLRPGQVMLVRDQLNLTGRSCLIGPEGREHGPVFPDMGAAYDSAWRAAIRAGGPGVALSEGVYAGVLGPAYETPAETRMLAMLGAQVVGMSTVQEVLAARQLGLAVACLSFVTNMAGGLGSALAHADVLELVARHLGALHGLLAHALEVAPR
jgi:purine-nucleoside phosphorylase